MVKIITPGKSRRAGYLPWAQSGLELGDGGTGHGWRKYLIFDAFELALERRDLPVLAVCLATEHARLLPLLKLGLRERLQRVLLVLLCRAQARAAPRVGVLLGRMQRHACLTARLVHLHFGLAQLRLHLVFVLGLFPHLPPFGLADHVGLLMLGSCDEVPHLALQLVVLIALMCNIFTHDLFHLRLARLGLRDGFAVGLGHLAPALGV
jgi:hypothetical protein